ncbi:MAG TPA: YggT family protein [Gemmatimonadaceae bacterium]|nr:YggT family protein [Gemmatimonadaceae bacterium]
MTSALAAFDSLLAFLRVTFLVIAVALAIMAAIDWMVRTRRLTPFGKVARFFRQRVDPLFAPVERRVVRAGGLPTAAPWWALAAVVLAGILVISLLGFLRGQLFAIAGAASVGPTGFVILFISWTFGILRLALIVRVVSSWIRVSPYSRWIRWSFVLTEPLLRPLRSVIPNIGMIDITPIAAFFALVLLEGLLLSGFRGM